MHPPRAEASPRELLTPPAERSYTRLTWRATSSDVAAGPLEVDAVGGAHLLELPVGVPRARGELAVLRKESVHVDVGDLARALWASASAARLRSASGALGGIVGDREAEPTTNPPARLTMSIMPPTRRRYSPTSGLRTRPEMPFGSPVTAVVVASPKQKTTVWILLFSTCSVTWRNQLKTSGRVRPVATRPSTSPTVSTASFRPRAR